MYQSSVRFGELIQQDSRTFHAKITIGEHSITEGIKNITVNGGSNSEDDFSIGSAVSQYVEITMELPGFQVEGHEFELKIGMDVDGVPEYVPMGYFTAEKPDSNEDQITFTAYDRMIKMETPFFMELKGDVETDTVSILEEISTITGVPVITDGLAAIPMDVPKGYTCREVLSYIAQMYGGFAVCNRSGQIEIRSYQDSEYTVPTSRYWGSFGHNDIPFLLEKLTCYTGKDSEGNDTSVSVGSGTREVSFSNPFLSQSILDGIWEDLQNYTYMPGSFKFLGDPRIDPWDVLTVEDRNGTAYKVPAMKLVQHFDGGLSTEVEAVGKSEAEQSSGFQGPNTKQMDRYYADLVVIEHGLFNKVDADFVEANYVKSTRFEGLQADFEETRTRYLEFETATGNDLTLIHGNIQTLEGDFASYKTIVANDFAAVSADITNLTGRYATFEQTVTEELITAKGWMLEGTIGSAQISSVDANKIKSGTIDTALVNIAGTDGRLQIIDNTIQISDANRVRVQVGKDASGDYTLAVWDTSGNLIWDALGATENTIQRKIIRDKMVADDAAIQALKLDLQSINTALTDQGVTISGTVVQVGNKTLNVELSEKTQLITEQGETIANQMTMINEHGEQITLHDVSIKSQSEKLTDHSTRIAANENAISLRVTTQEYESNKTTINNEIASAKSRLTTAESSITALNGQIALKVEQTDIDTAVNNLQVGGRNLLRQTKEYSFEGINARGNSTIQSEKYHDFTVRYLNCNGGDYSEMSLYVSAVTPEGGAQYVFSFYAKGTGIRAHFFSGGFKPIKSVSSTGSINYATDGLMDIALTSEWKRYWVVYTLEDTNTLSTTGNKHVLLRVMNGYEAYACGLMFEKGNKPSNWTPAPEDIDASISAVDAKFVDYCTITQMQSSIDIAKDSITQSVSATYATKASVETANGNITSLTSRVQTAESKLTKDGLTTIVGDYYTTATVVDSKIDEIEIGGRNLALKTGTKAAITGGNTTNQCVNIYNLSKNWTEFAGKYVTISFDYVYSAGSTCTNSSFTNSCIGIGMGASTWNRPANIPAPSVAMSGHISKTFLVSTNVASHSVVQARIDYLSGTCTISNFKFEIGNKATDWSPAPEDTESSISAVQTIAEQTATKFSWLVKSGTSSTDFILTDRTASLVADYINLNGKVTFSGLDSSAQSKINTAQSTADTAVTNAATAQSTANTANAKATYHYGTCGTEAATAAKTVTCAGFILYTGAMISVRFQYGNTATSPTLNVNGTGAKSIVFGGATSGLEVRAWNCAWATITFVYDGTYWRVTNDDASIKAYNAQTTANSANTTLADWCYNNDKTYINGSKIYTGTITATQIASKAITSDKINVTSLSAISANLGTVTSGIIKSANYAWTAAPYTDAGTYIDLSSGGIWSKNFTIDSSGNAYMRGNIEATSGKIGSFTIGTGLTYEKSSTEYAGIGGSIRAFWAGSATQKDAPFGVAYNGTMIATKGTIGGWKLSSSGIASSSGNMSFDSANGIINIGQSSISQNGNGIKINYGLLLNTSTSTFGDGTGTFQITGLSTVSSGGHLVFGSDGKTVSYLSSSSRRYKNHIGELTEADAAKIYDLPVVWFRYKDGYLARGDVLENKAIPGFYAEDVERTIPVAARYQNGVIEDWNERMIMPYVVKAAQVAKERIDILQAKTESEVDSLKSQVSSLQYQLEQAYMRIATLEKHQQAAG